MPDDARVIATVGEVRLPESVYQTFRVIALQGAPAPVEASLIFTERARHHAWSRANPALPVFALEGRRVIAMSFLHGRLVPQPTPHCDDLESFIRSVLEAITRLRREDAPQAPRPKLARREREVLEQLAAGRTIGETARALGIAEHTVRNYLTNVRYKLGVRNQSLALLTAIRYGLIDWPPLPG